MSYKLSCVLYGHKSDVRGLAITTDDYLVSCSRDKTAKLWKPNGHNSGYIELQTFTGHKNFVSSVSVVPANAVFPAGLVLTGGNDAVILAFVPDSSAPIFQLIGHENTVCKIVNGLEDNVIISASWDKKVKLWRLSSESGTCILTISDHEAAVWTALQARIDIIVTGSADKMIRLFKSDGKLISTLTGHTDCVRDVAKLNDNEILSCANDASVRRWSLNTGQCIETLYGHPNFIYNLHVRGDRFATVGEDRCLFIWANGDHKRILLPAQSIWSVVILSNTDVAVGSSDGVIRIFTTALDRQADDEAQTFFENEVAALNAKAEKMIGEIKVSDLPGPDALREAGTQDGQNRIIKENGEAICYSWSESEHKWIKVGKVVGGSDSKVLHEGKEFDFVFPIEFDDGSPPLKLPYNKSDDPWFVAQTFIHKHNLPQDSLEQIANFIINNSKQTNASVTTSSAQYADPFTGGNRYVPERRLDQNSGSNFDPFTGANRYVPVTNGANGVANTSTTDPFTGGNRYVPMNTATSGGPSGTFFPQSSYIRFDNANISQILDKLKTFNRALDNESMKLSEADLENLSTLCDPQNSSFSVKVLEDLKILLNWPKSCVFPVLDVLRLAIRNRRVNNDLCSDKFIFGYLKDNLQSDSPVVNQMLILRTLCNMLSHPAGEELVIDRKDFIFEIIGSFSDLSNKALQIALATLILNLSTVFFKKNDLESQSVMLLNLINIFPQLTESEAVFRALVALGTILSQSNELGNCIDSAIKQIIHNFTTSAQEKIRNCSSYVLSLIP